VCSGCPAHPQPVTPSVRTYVPVTSQGHRYAQLQRALKTGNAHLALAAAGELHHVDLADALSLVLLIRDDDPQRYDRAAVRWLARYAAHDRAPCGWPKPANSSTCSTAPAGTTGSLCCGSSGGYALAAMRMKPTGWPDIPITRKG
jgi:hypothetical protein